MTRAVPRTEPTLEQRIRSWIELNPTRAHLGERMLQQLMQIRAEFSGDTGRRLEALVEETLNRQLRIDHNRRAGLAEARRLSETMAQLTESMSECLLAARRAQDAAVSAAMSALQWPSEDGQEPMPSALSPATRKKRSN